MCISLTSFFASHPYFTHTLDSSAHLDFILSAIFFASHPYFTHTLDSSARNDTNSMFLAFFLATDGQLALKS